MNQEERRQYKTQKQREYRGQPKSVDNPPTTVDIPRGQLRSKPTGKYELEPLGSPPPKGVAKEQWDAATLRAEVARRYAQPERYQFIRPDEEVFQTIAWQLVELDRYPAPDAPAKA